MPLTSVSVSTGIPGPRGLPGTQVQLISNVTVGKACIFINNQALIANSTNINLADCLHGVCIAPNLFAIHGPVNSISLGSGVSCALGCTSDGSLCRVTDPQCNSKLKILGWCDEDGAITISPRVAEGFRLDDYGGDATGLTSSNTAFNAMVSSAISSQQGAECIIPAGTWKIDNKLTIFNVFGLSIRGEGGNQSILNWAGNSTDPLLLLSSCYGCRFSGFGIVASDTTLAIGVQITTSSAVGHHISTRNTFEHIGISGITNEIQECVVIGGDLNANNDFHAFSFCTFTNYNKRAIRISDSQSYQHLFINCFFQPIGYATTTGSMSINSPNLTVTTDTFTSADVGKFVEITNAFDGQLPLRTTIASVIDSKNVTLSANAGANVSSVLVLTGANEAIRADAGSYTVQGGATANHLGTDFFISNVSSQSCSLRDVASEGSRRFIASSGLSNDSEKTCIVDSCRYSGDGAIIGVPCIDWELGGQLLVQNSQIGDYGSDRNITIQLGSAFFSDVTKLTHRFENSIFAAASATKVTDIFTQILPSMSNCRIYSASFSTRLPDICMTDSLQFIGIDPTKILGVFTGLNSPEGSIIADIGSIYLRQNGGTNTTLYVKESGSSNTGWVGK